MVTPCPPRRSFVHHELAAAGASFGPEGDAVVALRVDDHDAARARRCGVTDLSPLWRTGFKGRHTLLWLEREGVRLEPTPNRAFRQPDGSLCAILAPTEVLLLGPLQGESIFCSLDETWSEATADRCWPVPRRDSHAWFLVTGEAAPAMFATLCAIDLRPSAFADGAIAQTSLAKLNGIVIRDDRGGHPAWHVLADSASANYLFWCLTGAGVRLLGGPTGLFAANHQQYG